MARRTHRKLFPTLSSSNQTQNCPEFCDPCPYNCYSFPDYYFPPPSSLSSSPPPSISSSSHSTPSSHIPSYFIILASLFSLLFILIGLYVIKTKCYPNWSPHASSSSSPSDASDQEFLEMDHHHHHHHHHHPIWLITTMGLHQSIINSITVCKYKRGDGLIEGTECSVCLNEFHEDETLRLLPKCSHAFHIPCIDTWLRSHTNCPLCRAGIVISNSNAVEPEDSGNSRTNIQEIQSENIPTNGVDELSNNEDVSVIIVNGVSGNRAETGEEHAKEDDGDDDDEGVLNDERRIIINKIRSMSMDARVDHKREGDYSMFKTKCLHVSPIAMKRSFSCSGRILSARGYRNLITSLPY